MYHKGKARNALDCSVSPIILQIIKFKPDYTMVCAAGMDVSLTTTHGIVLHVICLTVVTRTILLGFALWQITNVRIAIALKARTPCYCVMDVTWVIT